MEDKIYYYVEDFYGGMIIAEENIKDYINNPTYAICCKGTMEEIEEYIHGENEEYDEFDF